MKVIAINASPKMEKGNTAAILTPFLEGLREAGADVGLFYTKEMEIKPCLGDLACWVKTPGTCCQKDDMQALLDKLAQADLWVLATPVYVDGMAGPLKNLVDRLIPMIYPFYEFRDGHCRHPLRESVRTGSVALVSSCGFWEMDNFDPLVAHVKAVCGNVNREFAGALLRPHSRALMAMADRGEPVGDIFDTAKEAGKQMAGTGTMPASLLASISRPLLPADIYVHEMNIRFSQLIEEQAHT